MAHLWLTDDSLEWTVLPLAADTCDLSSLPPRPLATETRRGSAPLLTCLVRHPAAAVPAGWVVLCGSPRDLRIDAFPLFTGIHVLLDGDEIRVRSAGRAFFSTETLARVQPFPAAAPGACRRCLQAIAPGAPAVFCPRCGLWHHQSEDLPCWTYAETCAGCAQPSALDAGYQWSPAGL